jgi:hypothetical protein
LGAADQQLARVVALNDEVLDIERSLRGFRHFHSQQETVDADREQLEAGHFRVRRFGRSQLVSQAGLFRAGQGARRRFWKIRTGRQRRTPRQERQQAKPEQAQPDPRTTGTRNMHTEARRCRYRVGRIGGGNEQLAGMQPTRAHVVAIFAAFDKPCGRTRGPRSAVRGKARRPGTDYGDVNLLDLHLEGSWVCHNLCGLSSESLRRSVPPDTNGNPPLDKKTAGQKTDPAVLAAATKGEQRGMLVSTFYCLPY